MRRSRYSELAPTYRQMRCCWPPFPATRHRAMPKPGDWRASWKTPLVYQPVLTKVPTFTCPIKDRRRGRPYRTESSAACVICPISPLAWRCEFRSDIASVFIGRKIFVIYAGRAVSIRHSLLTPTCTGRNIEMQLNADTDRAQISAALELQKRRRNLWVLDRAGIAAFASQRHAGAITCFETKPVVTPGIMRKHPSWPDNAPIVARSAARPQILCVMGQGHLNRTRSTGTGELTADMAMDIPSPPYTIPFFFPSLNRRPHAEQQNHSCDFSPCRG